MPPDTNKPQATPGPVQQTSTTASPREGSTLYYSLLKVEPAKREELRNLLTLCKTLAGTLHDVSEVTVAEKKLHWWHEEIERLHNQSGADSARHPATVAVSKLITNYNIDAESWYEILRSNNDEKFINAADNKAFIARLTTDYGARISLCCQLLGNVQLAARQDWAIGLGLFDRLAQYRNLHQHGYPVLPDSDYAAAGIEPADIYDAAKLGAVNSLFKPRIADAHEHLRRAVQSIELADNFSAGMLPFHTLGRLRTKQLSVWLKQDVRPSESYVTLTPLRKAWISYRSRAPQKI